jgi:hypothetical protein
MSGIIVIATNARNKKSRNTTIATKKAIITANTKISRINTPVRAITIAAKAEKGTTMTMMTATAGMDETMMPVMAQPAATATTTAVNNPRPDSANQRLK